MHSPAPSSMPRFRDRVSFVAERTDRHTLWDNVSGRGFQIGPVERRVCELMDGTRDLQAISTLLRERHRLAVSTGTLAQFTERLRELDLLEGRRDDTPSVVRRPHRDRFFWTIRLGSPHALASWLADGPVGRRSAAGAAAVAVLVAAAGTLGSSWHDARATIQALTPATWLVALVATLAESVLHELAHAVAALSVGATVRSWGVALYYFRPSFFTEIAGLERVTRRARMAVASAGLVADLGVAATAVLVWAAAGDHSVGRVALAAAVLLALRTVFNLNPLLKYDGYYIVADAVGNPRLREDALASARRAAVWLRSPRSSTARLIGSSWLLAYASASLVYAAALLGSAAWVYAEWLRRQPETLRLVLALAGACWLTGAVQKRLSARLARRVALVLICAGAAGCGAHPLPAPPPVWEAGNPLKPLPAGPLGTSIDLAAQDEPPTPQTVRLGRWLFYDRRLSRDGRISCATCHRPEHAFSEATAVSTGFAGRRGTRKAPTFINLAVTFMPHFFWDGRAGSLEEQALGPIANPLEMATSHDVVVDTLSTIDGYRPYFREAFGTDEITAQRIASAIADYERTRMSGNSPWDRWFHGQDASAASSQVRQGHELFFGRAGCHQCHFGPNFTDSLFHTTGVGWDAKTRTFADVGRFAITGNQADRGAFKTPTLREVSRRAPYMHDGSIATLREVVDFYNRGGNRTPHTSDKLTPLGLGDREIDALVALMEALAGEGYFEAPPTRFPD